MGQIILGHSKLKSGPPRASLGHYSTAHAQTLLFFERAILVKSISKQATISLCRFSYMCVCGRTYILECYILRVVICVSISGVITIIIKKALKCKPSALIFGRAWTR